MSGTALILLIFGIVYLVKPDIYRRWLWRTTDIAQQKLNKENYIMYMRILGGAFVLGAIVLLAIGKFRF
jgi:hypothetical protein